MLITSLFLCHNIDQTEPKETQILDQLYRKLQDEGAKIADYPGSPAEEDFQSFLQQHLPTCQWFILFQTPALVSLPAVRQAVNTALKLVEQHKMAGVVRLIVTPSAPQEVPPEWANLPTYDATYDFARAAEKLLLHLSDEQEKSGATLFAPPIASASVATPVPATVMPPDYDRPPLPPSRVVKFGRALRNGTQDMFYERKRLVIVLSILLLLALAGSGLGLYLTRPASAAHTKAQLATQPPVYGQIYFMSTDMAIIAATTRTLDEVEINLQHLKSPAEGNSYYAWLLPDVASENGASVLVGQFAPENGSATLKYQSPGEHNLLATQSRFLITEESTSPLPDAPTADQSKWRYYGVFPQAPDPTDSSHFSALDHLRHLLVSGPASMMDAHSPILKGGLAVWLLQNVHAISNLALLARGNDAPPSPGIISYYCVEILDLLDGKGSISQDVPQNTPWLAGSTIASKPILTLDPNAMVPGYIHDIESHLLGLAGSPGVLQSQQALAGEIDTELNTVEQILKQAHDIAKQLVFMTDQQLKDASTIPLLDALANESMDAYVGQLDPTTGLRQGGVISAFDRLQLLAQFPVYQYAPQK